MATILVVDDLPSNRVFLVTVLRAHGYTVLEASDGAEGLAAARAGHPDLVITDVLMPVMDGFELLKQLRLDPAVAAIPVVFYTAHYGAREARALALSGGVSDVLLKPAAVEDVLAIVARMLSGASETAPPEPSLRPVEFDHAHLRLLTGKVASQVGDLRTANATLRALINIGLELASEGDPDRLLHRVCVATCELFHAESVTLGVLNRDDRTLQRFVTHGADTAATWIKTGEPVSGILGTVVQERRAMRGDHPGGDPAMVCGPGAVGKARALLVAPVASPAQVYGWICLVAADGKTFTENEEDLVTALAGLVGRIYESSHFSSVARKRADELEREIADRKQAESAQRDAVEALRIAEERMRFALEAARVGIWDIDFKTGVLRWSEILEGLYGLRPGTFDGTREAFIACVHPLDRDRMAASMGTANQSGADFSNEYRTLWPDGTVRWLSGAGRIRLDADGTAVRGVGICQDITERRVLEEQYQQAQKMEAVGQLAGGIAHDFNNLLTVILGTCELLQADLRPDHPHLADISEIQIAGTRAAGLTRQLLAFSRKQIIEPVILDLNAVVSGIKEMLGRLIGENVTIALHLAPAQACVLADRGQVEQVMMNLAVNARDAMPNGGTLTIETASVELDEHYAATHPAATPGPHIVLTMTDSGTGMTPEVQARLFEPFFTTKEPGKGTGLGMATVDGVVSRCGGSVGVYSEVGRGTSFRVYFPRVVGGLVVEARPSALRRSPGGETVLVVEDAGGLRELAKRLLERQGYAVLVAADAEQAMQIFAANPAIDVLLTDVVMPGGSGPELTARLAAQRPDLKVIYMSGYTEDAIVHHGVVDSGVAFLHKPFTAETLGRKIRDVLDR
jgi:PAS domain S-box-containing protein